MAKKSKPKKAKDAAAGARKRAGGKAAGKAEAAAARAKVAAMDPAERAALAEKLKPGKAKIELPKFDAEKTRAAVDEAKPTVSHMLGEMVWILSQSRVHKHLSIADLEWLIMPPLLLEQYRVFRGEDTPVGLALWAWLTPETEEKLNNSGRLAPHEWRAGGLTAGHFASGGGIRSNGGSDGGGGDADAGGQAGTLWLVDLIAPFATPENKQLEAMLGDLMQSVFKGQTFKLHKTDPETGKRDVVSLTAPA